MVTCPWCGTNYAAFQSNCDKCGGPLPAPYEQGAAYSPASAGDGSLPTPPPPPRPVANSYAWRLLMSDGWGIVGFIFVLIGAIFTVVGAALTVGIITALVGIPFLVLGLLLLAGGGALASLRYQAAARTVGVLRVGQAVAGQIVRVEANVHVRVNNRHPWVISYQFRVQERDYAGHVTTLNLPGGGLQPGQRACVLYLPQAPQHNTIYPHP
jgi:hypothetical protein